MLQAAGTQDKAPSIRAVYDHLRDASTVSAADIWQGIPPEQLGSVRIHDIDYVLTQMKRADEGEYVDSHVWTFTPESFVEQVHELGLLGRCDFEFEAMQPTQENSLEFYAVLRRLPRAVSPSARLARISESVQIALEAARSGPVPRGVDVAELQEQLREATAAAESLRQELAAVKSSERWRIGGLLVSPPRWALQQVRQRVHSP